VTVVDSQRVTDPSGGGVVAGAPACLVASRCTACGRTEFPARVVCPACGSTSPSELLPSVGRLVGFTAVLHPPPGTDVEVPYTIGVVEFDGRIRVLGQVTDPVDQLEIGLSVETVGQRVGADSLGYAFRS
jgi:uncharacterized OB-fold protein